MPDPAEQFLSLLRHEAAPYFFWRSPEGETLAAAGQRHRFEPAQPERWREWATAPLDADPDVPLIALSFFDPAAKPSEEWSGFPPFQFYQPAIAIQERHGECRQWGAPSCSPGISHDEPTEAGALARLADSGGDAETYRARVEQALGLLRRGELEKVVVARKGRIKIANSFSLSPMLHAMLRQPHAFTICYSPDGLRFFLSATPERLGRIDSGRFESMALAGTFPNVSDRDRPERDLLGDAKERSEHAYVVSMIRSAAASFATGISVDDRRTLELPHVKHILTRISARIREGCDLRHVIASLHPTPAVAGTPREAALALIAALEPFNRGLYAGCAGWFFPLGDGDVAVTIRSAMLCEGDAIVWAGAGIVGNSDAAAEERETRAKMRTMFDILGI